MKFGIIGYGILGQATHYGFNLNDPIIYDLKMPYSLNTLDQCDVIFICVPTKDSNDIKIVCDYVDCFKCTIVIRSTVPLGTCSALPSRVLYMPEFLRERHWQKDCVKRPIVLGSDIGIPLWLDSEDVICCSRQEAEVLKMFSNNYCSLRVAFANHFYDMCNKVGADYNQVLDFYNRIKHNQDYLQVHENLRGFDGKCLPKDLDFIIESMHHLDLDQTLFTSIKQDNQKWPKTIKS